MRLSGGVFRKDVTISDGVYHKVFSVVRCAFIMHIEGVLVAFVVFIVVFLGLLGQVDRLVLDIVEWAYTKVWCSSHLIRYFLVLFIKVISSSRKLFRLALESRGLW